VVGGTGLYLRAALAELTLAPPPQPGVRERLMEELASAGPQALHSRLSELAPWRAAQIDAGDSHRIVRALELHAAGALTPQREELWTRATRRPTLLVGLTMDRERLYARIDQRVEAMVAGGAIEEVQRADAAGASDTARKALGFSELLAGDVAAMQQHTRNYARRQLTWLRKLPGAWRLDVGDEDARRIAVDVTASWLAGRYPPAP
jgi:tRNA dimethylallyltransferase